MKKFVMIKNINNLKLGRIQIDDIEDNTVIGNITFIKNAISPIDVFYIRISYNNGIHTYFEKDIISLEHEIINVKSIL